MHQTGARMQACRSAFSDSSGKESNRMWNDSFRAGTTGNQRQQAVAYFREISMRILTLLVVALSLGLGSPAPALSADNPVKRLLYVTSRDGAGGKGEKGIYVYDIDHGHKLVKFIPMLRLGGTRGVCASAGNGKLWIAHANDKLLCMDLKTEQVLWENQYTKEDGGCDRIGVTP